MSDAAAHHDRVTAIQRNARAVQQEDHARGRARLERGVARDQGAQIRPGEPVHVLVRGHGLSDLVVIEMTG